jgi:tRNA threonylcarbamoyladenosine biosynthesis protein TsaE
VKKFQTRSEKETRNLAERLIVEQLELAEGKPLVIGLNGDLGTGKTIFTKAIAEFLEIDDIVTSPTYTYGREYPLVRKNQSGVLHHLDLYRVDNKQIFSALDWENLLKPGNIVIIEWWSQVVEFADFKPNLIVNLEQSEENDDFREITVVENENQTWSDEEIKNIYKEVAEVIENK